MKEAAFKLAIRALKRLTLRTRKNRPRTARTEASDPALHAKWLEVRAEYFPDRIDLDRFTVRWSRRRQKRVLGSCSLRRRLVSVAKEMNHPLAAPYLPALLYHEMCHAALGEAVGQRGSRKAWHGERFRSLEAKHPDSKALDAWIRSGGWAHVVRSARASSAAKSRVIKGRN